MLGALKTGAKSLEELIGHSQVGMAPEKAKTERELVQSIYQRALQQEDGALKEFKAILAKLKSRRVEQELREGDPGIKKRNRMLETAEAKIIAEIQTGKQEQKLAKKSQLEASKKQDTQRMIMAGLPVHKNVIMPTYEKDERLKVYREVDAPPESIYMAVGYDGAVTDQAPVKGERHYRKFYMDELENNHEIFCRKPFHKIAIMRGQSRGLNPGFFDKLFGGGNEDESGNPSDEKQVGEFKGHVMIYNQKNRERYVAERAAKVAEMESVLNEIHLKRFGKRFKTDIRNLESAEEKHKFKRALVDMDAYKDDLMKFLTETSYEESLQRQLATPTDCLVRLYLLEGFDFASRDIGSFSDPYVVVRCGKNVISRRDKYQLDEPNPKLHEVFEFHARFPGAPNLEILAYDFDDLFGDDLIGKTSIDLDDRQFSPEWRAIADKPIEYRELYHPSTSLAQGTILCWLELEAQGKKNPTTRKWDITPEPSQDYQLRVAVYNTKNVPMEDLEGTSDVYVKAWIDEKESKETDTHWRCTGGEAAFNYRLLFDFKSPTYSKSEREAYKLRLQLFDRDLFKSNDFICEFTLDLRLLVLDCRATQRPVHLSEKYYTSYFRDAIKEEGGVQIMLEFEDEDSFWLSVKRPKDKLPIKIRLDVRVLPGKDAKNQQVGSARSEPNHSPKLSAPLGRMKFSMNPLEMLGQLVGPEFKAKLYAYAGTLLCLALCIMMAPMLASELTSKLVLNMVGLGG